MYVVRNYLPDEIWLMIAEYLKCDYKFVCPRDNEDIWVYDGKNCIARLMHMRENPFCWYRVLRNEWSIEKMFTATDGHGHIYDNVSCGFKLCLGRKGCEELMQIFDKKKWQYRIVDVVG